MNSLKDQLHKITDSFNKELNSLMDAYGKGIGSTLLQEDRMEQKQKSEYVAFDPSQINAQQQNGKKAKKSVTFSDKVKVHKYEEQKTIDNDPIYDVPKPQSFQMYDVPKSQPQHLQIHDLPKRAQVSEKPKIAPKPSKEIIDRALSKAGTSANQQNRPQELNIPIAPKIHQKLGNNIKGLVDKIGNKIPMSSPETSPKQSPTSSKKSFFAIFKSDDVQNKASKIQETKQSTSYSVSKGIPTPPPMPTQDDLKIKPTSRKELDVTSQINPKKRTATEGKTTEGKNVTLMQSLNENPLFKKRKGSIEEDKPQTKFTTPKMEHEKSTPTIGG